jgi:hypothetical protein
MLTNEELVAAVGELRQRWGNTAQFVLECKELVIEGLGLVQPTATDFDLEQDDCVKIRMYTPGHGVIYFRIDNRNVALRLDRTDQEPEWAKVGQDLYH